MAESWYVQRPLRVSDIWTRLKKNVMNGRRQASMLPLRPLPAADPPIRVDDDRSRPQRDIFDKCATYTSADEAKAKGIYPYFRLIETGQDTEVMVDGQAMLMLG